MNNDMNPIVARVYEIYAHGTGKVWENIDLICWSIKRKS